MGGGARIAESVKARARRASLLQNEDFRLLLEQTSVGDIAAELGKSAYASILKGFVLEEMRRDELEFLLSLSNLAEGAAFGHYAGASDRKLLSLWLETFDIELLKNYFRVKLGTGKKVEYLAPHKMLDLASGFHLTLVDKNKLLAGNTLKETLASVKSETLRASLMEVIPSERENASETEDPRFQKSVFAVGMILDRYYFDSLYSAVADLGGNEGRMMRMLAGTRVDLMNLYWIYRARRFFNMSPEESLTLIMKARYRLNFELLTKAAFAETRALGAVLEGTPYAWLFDVEGKEAALREMELERNICRLLYALAERVFLSGSLGFQNVAAYLILKELEVRDLVAVVETVRYGFDRNKIDLILVRSLGKGN
jgi:V/A-type H+-transporting ATPase subunit C